MQIQPMEGEMTSYLAGSHNIILSIVLESGSPFQSDHQFMGRN